VKSLFDLLDDASLKRLATPSNLRLGREIAAKGGVEILTRSPSEVTAKVQPPGGQKRTTELFATEDGLKCRCT
jgi:hypothetical protein